MDIEQRVDKVEEAISIMKDLPISRDERLEAYFKALSRERQEREESRKDFEFKMNAVIEMQMQNESTIRELREASRSQLTRIEKLEDK